MYMHRYEVTASPILTTFMFIACLLLSYFFLPTTFIFVVVTFHLYIIPCLIYSMKYGCKKVSQGYVDIYYLTEFMHPGYRRYQIDRYHETESLEIRNMPFFGPRVNIETLRGEVVSVYDMDAKMNHTRHTQPSDTPLGFSLFDIAGLHLAAARGDARDLDKEG